MAFFTVFSPGLRLKKAPGGDKGLGWWCFSFKGLTPWVGLWGHCGGADLWITGESFVVN